MSSYQNVQNEMLYVSDPLALHHIVVKDQYIYEETSSFIEYASALQFLVQRSR